MLTETIRYASDLTDKGFALIEQRRRRQGERANQGAAKAHREVPGIASPKPVGSGAADID